MAENTQTQEAQPQMTDILLRMLDRMQKQQEQIDQLTAALANGNGKKNGRGGRHEAQHVLDLKTNKVYRTKAEAGMAVAPEYGLQVHNFVWYELVKGTKNKPAKCPERFKVISDEEYEERLKKQKTQPAQPQGKQK